MQGHSRLPLCGVVSVLAVVAAFSAAPAFALPRTYQVNQVDSPEPQGTSLNRVGDRFGDGIANSGDVNGDGEEDILVGIDRRSTIIDGKVFVLSGVDGSLILSIPAPSDDVPGDPTPDGLDGDAPAGFGSAVSRFADVGQCPGGTPGENCTLILPEQNTPDQIPELLVSAVGLDIASESDDLGVVFVLDGGSGAILKRIAIPGTGADVGFGRALLWPSGQPACAGFAGLGVCPASIPEAVTSGDVDGGLLPDVVVGAPDFNETAATNTACGGSCTQAGRVYVFYGEALELVGPGTFPAAGVTIQNPRAQHDGSDVGARYWPESFGASLIPVGDLGTCATPGSPAFDGDFCPNQQADSQLDGKPEFVVSAPGTDASTVPDAGAAFAIGAVANADAWTLDTYGHPEPQAGSTFGFANGSFPAIGDVGGVDNRPDVYLPAIGQGAQFEAQGRGYVFSGQIGTGDGSSQNFSVLNDPTPAKVGNFGTSSAGIGNVAGSGVGLNSRGEVLIGAYGPHAPLLGVENVVNDVHIFSPLTDQVLQTIPDPDQQPGSGFGRGLVPLGDVNDDGSLDFAAGAGGHDSTAPVASNRGRIYLFMSDDSPAPAPPPTQPVTPAGGGTTPSTPAQALAGRALELEASRKRISSGARVTFRGVVEAFARRVTCERNQSVEIQRRRRGTVRYRTLGRVRTNSSGSFALRTRPRSTYFYRARLAQTSFCLGVVSAREEVIVRRAASRARR